VGNRCEWAGHAGLCGDCVSGRNARPARCSPAPLLYRLPCTQRVRLRVCARFGTGVAPAVVVTLVGGRGHRGLASSLLVSPSSPPPPPVRRAHWRCACTPLDRTPPQARGAPAFFPHVRCALGAGCLKEGVPPAALNCAAAGTHIRHSHPPLHGYALPTRDACSSAMAVARMVPVYAPGGMLPLPLLLQLLLLLPLPLPAATASNLSRQSPHHLTTPSHLPPPAPPAPPRPVRSGHTLAVYDVGNHNGTCQQAAARPIGSAFFASTGASSMDGSMLYVGRCVGVGTGGRLRDPPPPSTPHPRTRGWLQGVKSAVGGACLHRGLSCFLQPFCRRVSPIPRPRLACCAQLRQRPERDFPHNRHGAVQFQPGCPSGPLRRCGA
jgi:hypothetical protein